MTGNELATRDQAGESLARVIIDGNLEGLSPAQRLDYYREVCDRTGQDIWQRPYDLIRLNGKVQLYPNARAAANLARQHGISLKRVDHDMLDGIYTVTVQASAGDQEVEDIGAVPIDGLKGDSRANAMKKAHTQARRRAIFAMLGLGTSAEEMADVQGAERVTLNVETGEIRPAQTETKPLPDLDFDAVAAALKAKQLGQPDLEAVMGMAANKGNIRSYMHNNWLDTPEQLADHVDAQLRKARENTPDEQSDGHAEATQQANVDAMRSQGAEEQLDMAGTEQAAPREH